jgi:hypothetical protein
MSAKPINLEAIESILESDPYDVELGRLARVFLPTLIAELREARRKDAHQTQLISYLEDEVGTIRTELEGARATIEHLSTAMSWVSGHDRSGADHLEEMMQASTQRDAAEALLEEIRALARRNLGHASFTLYELRALLERNPA